MSTEEYFASANAPVAQRPRNSVLDSTKIDTSGFVASDVAIGIGEYLRGSGNAEI